MSGSTEIFFDLIESVDLETGKFTFKTSDDEVAKIHHLARKELDLIPPIKPKTLAKKIFEAFKDVEFYKERLSELKERNLSPEQREIDNIWWKYHLFYAEAGLAKLKSTLKQKPNKKTDLSYQVDSETVKQSVNIVEVISRYISLKRKGRDFWGLCPFHQEKTPSFSVNQARQFFYCFGCQISGDVFSFVQRIENVDFKEALGRLAV